LSQPTLDRVFGRGYRLRPRTWLSQTGQFAAQETVTLIGSTGQIQNVRLMGPPRSRDQIELSRTDELALGIEAPVRVSGDLDGTPGIFIEGPAGRVALSSGVISARRHVHMSPQDAERLTVRDGQTVHVKVDSKDRDLVFGDVTVRIARDFRLELHLDTDEANAAGIKNGDYGELLIPDQA
jgi:propanediol utilization protein